MEITDSFVKITFDPDDAAIVLVDYGDGLWSPIDINGEQIVQVQGFTRAAGIKAIPRGNDVNSLRFEKAVEHSDLEAAWTARLAGVINLPRVMGDVLIELESGQKWRLKNAAVRAWQGGQEEHVSRQVVDITGGVLTIDEGSYGAGIPWEELTTWEGIY